MTGPQDFEAIRNLKADYPGLHGISAMRLVRTRIDLLVGEPSQAALASLIAPDPHWIPDA